MPDISGALRSTGTHSIDQSSHSVALANPEDFIRVRLQLDAARLQRDVERLKSTYAAEETAQRALDAELADIIGHLQEDIAEFSAIVERLESRLERLEYAGRAMSDDELDDQDFDERVESATFWAEWRSRREETRREAPRQRQRSARKRVDQNVQRLYRRLARLIHPDLVDEPEVRARRETAMRLANEAYEARDAAQLERLLNVWIDAQNDHGASAVPTPVELRASIEKLNEQIKSLKNQIRELENTETGKLLRMDRRNRNRYLERERERLRRELASLRLRRRRLQRAVDSRREELTEVSD